MIHDDTHKFLSSRIQIKTLVSIMETLIRIEP